jgi:hypothetical protein
MNPLDFLLSPIFWAMLFIGTTYFSYKCVKDKRWLSGERQNVKIGLECIGGIASGYAFHSALLKWLIEYHNDIVSIGWVVFLIFIVVLIYDVLKDTRHLITWGFVIISFIIGMELNAICAVIF